MKVEEIKKILAWEHTLGLDHIPINHYYNDEKGEWNKTPYPNYDLKKHYSYKRFSTLKELEEYINYGCKTFAIRLGRLRDSSSSNSIIGIDCDSPEYAKFIDYLLTEEGLDTMKEVTPRGGMHFYFILEGTGTKEEGEEGEGEEEGVGEGEEEEERGRKANNNNNNNNNNSYIDLAQGTGLDIKLYLEKRYFIHIGEGYNILNNIDKIKYINEERLDYLVTLLRKVIGLCHTLAEGYSKGQRDLLWFYLSGFMRKSNVRLEEALKICKYTCYFFHDEEASSRLKVVEDTYNKDKEEVKGFEGLKELGLNTVVLQRIQAILASYSYRPSLDINNKEYTFVCQFLLAENRARVERALFIDNYRYVNEEDGGGYWIHWQGVWRAEYAESRLIKELFDYCEDVKKELKRQKQGHATHKEELNYFMQVTKSKATMNELVATLSMFLSINSELLDSLPENVIVAKNCAIRVTYEGVTTIPLEEVKEYYPTRRVNAIYDPNAKYEKFIAYLTQICNGDIEKVNFLIRLLGSFLMRRKEEYCYIFYGSGANGKSTLLKVVTTLLGDYARYSNISIVNAREEEGKNPELIASNKKHLVCVFEPKQVYLNTANLKALTSLEPKSVRPLYHMPIEIIPDFHLVIATNNKPIITEFTLGMLRRLVMVNFDYIIPEEQRISNYADILLQESSGILNLMIAGLQAVMKEGRLIIPEVVKRETAEWIYELDILQEFIDRYLVMTYNDKDRLEFSVVYEKFKFFAQLKGRDKGNNESKEGEGKEEADIMSKQEFSKRLKDKGFTTTRIKKVTYICRAKWKEGVIEEEEEEGGDSGNNNNNSSNNDSGNTNTNSNNDNSSSGNADTNSGSGNSNSNSSDSNNGNSGNNSSNNTNLKERRVWRISELQPIIRYVQEAFVDIEQGYRCKDKYCNYTHEGVTLYTQQIKVSELHKLPDLILHISNPLLIALQELLDHANSHTSVGG